MLRELVERAIAVKIDVVVADLKETGGAGGHPGREVLNYGHTLAHAIERAEDYRIRHGEAVAIGCVYVAELAAPRRVARPADLVDRHRSGLRPGRPADVVLGGVAFDELRAAMSVDKKSRGSQLRFVVLDDLARPRVLAGPDEAMLRAAYDAIDGRWIMRVLVLNGPNLGRLGRRQPEIYGATTHDRAGRAVRGVGCASWGSSVDVRQTNHEGELLDWLNTAADEGTPVVLNAGAWTHYSLALCDACAQLTAPLVEVHISDPRQRPEEFRHTSVVEPHAIATIAGRGDRRLPAGPPATRRPVACSPLTRRLFTQGWGAVHRPDPAAATGGTTWFRAPSQRHDPSIASPMAPSPGIWGLPSRRPADGGIGLLGWCPARRAGAGLDGGLFRRGSRQ